MKRGPKLQPGRRPVPGTAKPDLVASCATPRSPIMPEYLADDEAMEPARTVWMENIERVAANGLTESDSDLFARYCVQEAGYRAHIALFFRAEMDAPPTSLVESLRKMAELLGIAGPSSRQRLNGMKAPIPTENAFARNGRRP